VWGGGGGSPTTYDGGLGMGRVDVCKGHSSTAESLSAIKLDLHRLGRQYW
jgi:hypothetical protein